MFRGGDLGYLTEYQFLDGITGGICRSGNWSLKKMIWLLGLHGV